MSLIGTWRTEHERLQRQRNPKPASSPHYIVRIVFCPDCHKLWQIFLVDVLDWSIGERGVAIFWQLVISASLRLGHPLDRTQDLHHERDPVLIIALPFPLEADKQWPIRLTFLVRPGGDSACVKHAR